VTNYGPGINMRRLIELNQGRTDLQALVRLAEQSLDVSRTRRGNLNYGFLGLDGNQGFIDHNVIAFGDVPCNDLGILETFAQIRKIERTHA
jgi:hypothetical protein